MGRSKRKTRGEASNRRLRSAVSDHFSPVPYADPRQMDFFQSPTPLSPNYSSRRVPKRTPSRVPSRPRPIPTRANGRSVRSILSSGVWSPAGGTPSQTPGPVTERSSMVCVRRSTRREVLHALHKTGKSGQKSPIYNRLSKIHCRSKK